MCRFHFETENDIFLEATVNNKREILTRSPEILLPNNSMCVVTQLGLPKISILLAAE